MTLLVIICIICVLATLASCFTVYWFINEVHQYTAAIVKAIQHNNKMIRDLIECLEGR